MCTLVRATSGVSAATEDHSLFQKTFEFLLSCQEVVVLSPLSLFRKIERDPFAFCYWHYEEPNITFASFIVLNNCLNRANLYTGFCFPRVFIFLMGLFSC